MPSLTWNDHHQILLQPINNETDVATKALSGWDEMEISGRGYAKNTLIANIKRAKHVLFLLLHKSGPFLAPLAFQQIGTQLDI